MITAREKRVPTLLLKHNQITRLADEMVLKPLEYLGLPWNIDMDSRKLIENIFGKLQDMFHRYKDQICNR
jgi:hypothetical protein